jgi:hypothetical protein
LHHFVDRMDPDDVRACEDCCRNSGGRTPVALGCGPVGKRLAKE